MAGEIQEPFRLGFQADSVHSGSISFGRFESEVLCWDRWSSFTQNRYLEEVEKCSKPGSVIEKKAYFEAQFRKKSILRQSCPDFHNETKYQESGEEISEKMQSDEENTDYMNGESHSACADGNSDGSVLGNYELAMQCQNGSSETSVLEPQDFLANDCTTDADYIPVPEHVKREEANPASELGDIISPSVIETKENVDVDMTNASTTNDLKIACLVPNECNENWETCPKDSERASSMEKNLSPAVCMKQRSMPRSSVAQNRRNVSENKPSVKITRVPVRSRAEKETSEAAAPNKHPMQKNTESKPGSKAQVADEIRRSTTECQSSRQKVKVPTRAHQSVNSIKSAIVTKKPGKKQGSSSISFKSDERAQIRKEFDLNLVQKMNAKEDEMHKIQAKTQEKREAEIKQLRKSLNFKAKPMPSFYHGTLRSSNRKKIPSNDESQKQGTKSSRGGTRVCQSSLIQRPEEAKTEQPVSRAIDHPQVSGGTSCHSTVTSESRSSSPAAETNFSHPSNEGRKNLEKKLSSREKERSIVNHKAPDATNNNRKIHTGKTMLDGKPKTRTAGSSPCVAFKNSLRTGKSARALS